MRGRVGQIGRRWGAAPLLLALVLAFRLLIPAGYMIAPGQDGLVFCGPVAAQPALHDGHEGHPDAPAAPTAGELPCPYAAVAAPPVPQAPPAILPPLRAEGAPPHSIPAEGRILTAMAAPPPPATGPPRAF